MISSGLTRFLRRVLFYRRPFFCLFLFMFRLCCWNLLGPMDTNFYSRSSLHTVVIAFISFSILFVSMLLSDIPQYYRLHGVIVFVCVWSIALVVVNNDFYSFIFICFNFCYFCFFLFLVCEKILDFVVFHFVHHHFILLYSFWLACCLFVGYPEMSQNKCHMEKNTVEICECAVCIEPMCHCWGM